MKNVFVLNKKEGDTPLETLDKFRDKQKKKNPIYENIKMTYAGRLDPMASGLLIVLSGDEVKNKEKYLKLDKEYIFEVLFGVKTDTYDILGKIINHKSDLWQKEYLQKKIKENLKFFIGKFNQTYPIYSSKTVKGRQLFEYARSGEDVKLPSHQVFVKSLKFIKLRKINNKKLFENIEKRIIRVKGDFRQEEIINIWRNNLISGVKNLNYFFIGTFKIKCSSGTYVRSIANNLGEKLNLNAIAYSIKRTKIGKYK